MAGGSTLDTKPLQGWLVLVCFHTLWSEACVRSITALNELVPTYQDAATFLAVRADTYSLAATAKAYKIMSFPTVVAFRDGKEIARFEGHLNLSQRVVQFLGAAITEDDKVAMAKRRHRIRLEKQSGSNGGASQLDDSDEAPGDVIWAWDVEAAGESINVEDCGLTAKLIVEDDDFCR